MNFPIGPGVSGMFCSSQVSEISGCGSLRRSRVTQLEAAQSKGFQYRGVWLQDTAYDKDDFCTFFGSLWHSSRWTKAKPGDGSDWRLAVKRGQDGRDGKDLR